MKLEPELLEEPLVLARLVPGNRKKQICFTADRKCITCGHKLITGFLSDVSSWRSSPLLKLDFGLPPGFTFESRVPEDVLVDDSFVQRNINRVSDETIV